MEQNLIKLEKELESKKAFNNEVYEETMCKCGFEWHKCTMRKNLKDGELYCPRCQVGKSILIK